MSDILQQHLDSVNERNQKNNLSELLKSKDINSMDLDSLSSTINDSTDLDLSKDEDKKLAIKFLQEIAKKTENQKKIEETDISSIGLERSAFTKILDLVKAFENKKEMESKIFWFTWEELDLLNNFIGEKNLIVKQTKDKINTTKDNVEKTVDVKNESKEERKEIKTQESNNVITWTFWSEKNKWEQWKNVNELSLSNLLEQKSGSALNSLYSEMKNIAETDNKSDWKYKFWVFNSKLEELLKNNWYKANWSFWWVEMWSIFQIIEDVVLTQKTIDKKDYKSQIAIMFDNNRDCVLDNNVHFYVQEEQFFESIKTPKNWDNLLKNLWYNWKVDFDKELANNYFSARKNFETRLATILHQPEILLRVNPGEMINNPNAVKERIKFTQELVWSIDKALNDTESKDKIKAKIKEIKEQNWDNSPVTDEETKSIIDQIKLKSVWIIVWEKNWAALSFDIKSLTKDILSTLNIGCVNWVWGIWVAKDFEFLNWRLVATWWIINLIPYVWARWIIYKWDTNANFILWKTNIDSSYDVWLSGWASFVWAMGAIDISKVDEETQVWIKNLKAQMSATIDEVFEDIDAGNEFSDSRFKTNPESKQAYELLMSQYKTYKDKDFIKTWILNNYERELYKQSQWWKITWITAWLAGMFPFIWVKFEYHDTKWSEVGTIQIPWKNTKNGNNVNSNILKIQEETSITNDATMTNSQREAAILALEDKFSYKTRYNHWAYDFMNPNASLDVRWNWLKTLTKSTKALRDTNLSKIITEIEKTKDVNQKSHLISVLSQFTRKSNDFNNGNISDWNTKLEERKKIEKENRGEFNKTLWFSLDSESSELYSKLWKWKIWSTKLDGISFDLIASKNVEWKSLKWIELLNAKSSILTIDGKPAWVDITDKSKIEAFTKKIHNTNLVNWIKSWEIVLKLAKDPYGWDDKIIPIKKSQVEKIESVALSNISEVSTKIDVYNPEYKVIDWVVAYVWDKINDNKWNWKPEMWTTPGEEKWSQITSTPTETTSPWQTTTSSWTWFNPNN